MHPIHENLKESLFITLADTWFHLTITTVEITLHQIRNTPQLAFGRRLNPACLPNDLQHQTPCDLAESMGAFILMGAAEGYKTMGNMSTTNQLFNVQYSGSQYVLLGDSLSTQLSLDFMASTVAMNTQCEVISKYCGLHMPFQILLDGISLQDPSQIIYNCSSAFNGDFPSNSSDNAYVAWRMGHFNDTALEVPTDAFYSQNPSIIAMAALVKNVGYAIDSDGNPMAASIISGNVTDSDIVINYTGGVSFVLRCTATVYDINYTFVNGSISNLTRIQLSNDTLSRIINVPQHENFTFGTSYFELGAVTAIFSDTAQEVADKMALTYSRTALGMTAGVFVAEDNLLEETWQNVLVAKIPFAPFYVLLTANLLIVCVGILLLLVALRGRKLGMIVSMISISGVVAYGFEKISEGITSEDEKVLFEEGRTGLSKVVGVAAADDGGWKYSSWGARVSTESEPIAE